MTGLGAIEGRAREVVGLLRSFKSGQLAVRNFRLNYSEGRSANLGIYDSHRGGVYSPFQLSDGARGALLLEWSDGKISRTSVDGNVGAGLGPALEAAVDARYRDDEAREFVAPRPIPRTPVYDRRVDRIVAGSPGLLYDIVDLIAERGRKLRAKKISGTALAAAGGSVVATSRGLWHAGLSTDFRFSFSYDAELWDGLSRRRPIPVSEAARVIDRAAALLPSLRRRDPAGRSGPARVLALPHFAADLVEAYVLGNLSGAEVATGQSAFKAEDFHHHRQVFRDDLSLTVDPTVPYESGSYRITAEGLPARREVYLEGGRLLRPIVGLKYARRLKVKPSTPPAAMESVVLEMGRSRTLARALAAMDDGFVVLSALGLHTQDSASGDFSLTAPQAIVVGGGKLRGSIKAVLAGNFFAALRDPRTAVVRVPGYRFAGLQFDCHVTAG